MAIDENAPHHQHELTPTDDREEWGKKDHPVQADDMVLEPAPHSPEQAGNWREALVEAWPKLVIILTIFGLALLMMSSISWSDVKDATKWPPFLWSIIFFLVASVFGKRKQNFRFLFFYAVGIITALWI